MSQTKNDLRKEILANRDQGHDCGHSHSQLLIDFAWEKRAKKIACYISFGDEPSTNVFLKHCQLDDRIELFVPRVVGDDLEWVLFDDEQVRHPLGMAEPVGQASPLSEVDLAVIPALAADRLGNRLGRGRGFYDRALSKLHAKLTIAVVHEDELLDVVPTETHDFKVDAICTCSGIIEI